MSDAGWLYLLLRVLWIQSFVDLGVWTIGLLDASLLVYERVRYILLAILLLRIAIAEDLGILIDYVLEASSILALDSSILIIVI